jgi:polyribonucleotide nucleotidyltransferase
MTFHVAPSRVGALIGPQGSTIKSIQQETGTIIKIPSDGSGTVHISGPTLQVIEIAIVLMDMKTHFIDLPDKVFVSGIPGSNGPNYFRQVMRFPPETNLGKLIGKGGTVIDSLRIRTGAMINVSLDSTGAQVIVVSSSLEERVQNAIEEIHRILSSSANSSNHPVHQNNYSIDNINTNDHGNKIYASPDILPVSSSSSSISGNNNPWKPTTTTTNSAITTNNTVPSTAVTYMEYDDD